MKRTTVRPETGRDVRMQALCDHLRAAIDILQTFDPALTPQEITKPEIAQPAPVPPAVEPDRDRLLYTVLQAANAAGISRSTLYDALRSGALEAVKLGHRTMIPVSTLHSWIAALPMRPVRRGAEDGRNL